MNILNYQGNKTKLLKFINKYCKNYIQDGKAVLDIFSGGGAVCSDFAKSYVTYANDLEPYSSQISKAFICKPQYCDFDETFYCKFESAFKGQSSKLIKAYESFVEEEKLILKSKSAEALINFYQRVPTFWNHLTSPLLKQKITSSAIVNRAEKYCLFTLLYPTSYFSLMQTIEIDALRRAIDETDQKYNTAYLNTCLFHAMNMTVFSKDGHMAQPLNLEKNTARGFKRKSLSISDILKYGKNIDVKSLDSLRQTISKNGGEIFKANWGHKRMQQAGTTAIRGTKLSSTSEEALISSIEAATRAYLKIVAIWDKSVRK